MAELGAAAAAAGLLGHAIDIMYQIRRAKQQQANLSNLLAEEMATVETTKIIVDFVQGEKALATPNIEANAQRIKDTAQALSTYLEGLQAKANKGGAHSFARQLFFGAEDQKKISALTSRLRGHKMDLIVNIGLVNVGLVRLQGEALAVNSAAVEGLDARIQALVGKTEGLRIAKMVQGRPKDANGNVALTPDDIAVLSGLDEDAITNVSAATTGGPPLKVRRIQNNIALKNSLQVNTPIGEDIWADMDVIVVENNIADIDAAQFNYPMKSEDVFLRALEIKFNK